MFLHTLYRLPLPPILLLAVNPLSISLSLLPTTPFDHQGWQHDGSNGLKIQKRSESTLTHTLANQGRSCAITFDVNKVMFLLHSDCDSCWSEWFLLLNSPPCPHPPILLLHYTSEECKLMKSSATSMRVVKYFPWLERWQTTLCICAAQAHSLATL